MKQKSDNKSQGKAPSAVGSKKGGDKASKPEGEEVENQEPKENKPKVIEKFIHVTRYSDHETMTILTNLFKEINQKAFNLRSDKEINTRELSEEEKDNNEIDYISGVQLIDKDIRITILEGITGKAMEIIKERLPKYQMNTPAYIQYSEEQIEEIKKKLKAEKKNLTKEKDKLEKVQYNPDIFKIFSDSRILFDKRAYSEFGLSLKYIKLRDTLHNTLTHFNIYEKADKYRDVYDTFLNYGSILECDTLLDIFNEKLLPDSKSLLQLEKYYADLLTEEDMTGIPEVKKKRTKISVADLEKMPSEGMGSTYYSGTSRLDNKGSVNSSKVLGMSQISSKDGNGSKLNESQKLNQSQNLNDSMLNGSNKMRLKAALCARNEGYEEQLLNHHKETKWETLRRNMQYIKTMKTKPKDKHFCRPYEPYDPSVDDHKCSREEIMSKKIDDEFVEYYNQHCPKIYTHSPNYLNYFAAYMDYKGATLAHDKDHHYTYSLMGNSFSFPLVPQRNQEYYEYVQNKKKWKGKGGIDFDRYKQPKREKWYFPKIDNPL